mmetsp:Transcript_25834/g.54605  ORF Transcript_25834/g.54605 Transcript_25834/m.54605 type:complete len:287 (+) Transcript_25834:97-957(+)|eukprot:CAMPEP_0183733052 /NCGR_PEP_ID=MMETSP0737-20130205/40048_1 /TAXON_ID=385413 /ORGANISM="Thalassiosira miniscula, Strain CCMP1093" /LENGTH=286 /DNA_ID=CAMNT_0025966225 /DNA_START=78 /DNA_END=938 /DNA_ORIENTATION=+
MADQLDHDAIDELPAPLVPAVTAPVVLAPGEAGSANDAHVANVLGYIQQLQAGQNQQTLLLQKLHKTVLTSRAMINELVVANNELKEELRSIKTSSQCDACKKKEHAFVARTMLTVAGHTGDDEIDRIIEQRKLKQAWPVKHAVLNCFSVQNDLVKLRFHHSEKYQHIPIRIPKTDKNKDGTKPCKLCSEGKIRRKTTWMCSTCEVPLCTRPLMDEDGASMTHHARWHSVKDLLLEHKKVHDALKNGRESRKRARQDEQGGVIGNGAVEHAELAPQPEAVQVSIDV